MATIQAEAARPRRAERRQDPNPAFFAEHRDGAYRVAWRLLGDPQAALRIVAASFIRAFQGSPGDESSEVFKTRLHRIQVDLVRSQPRPKAEAAEKGTRMTNTQRMLRALRTLPGEQREAFALAIDGQMSYQEIAAVQGVSTETAMQRIYNARRALHALLTGKSKRAGSNGGRS